MSEEFQFLIVNILTSPDTALMDSAQDLKSNKSKVKCQVYWSGLQSLSEHNFPHLYDGNNKNIYLVVFVWVK